jgi:hypothetical protein
MFLSFHLQTKSTNEMRRKETTFFVIHKINSSFFEKIIYLNAKTVGSNDSWRNINMSCSFVYSVAAGVLLFVPEELLGRD